MVVATYSICACDLEARQWGVAVQSKFLARRLGRSLGGAARRRDRDAVVGQPALRAGRARAASRGAAGAEEVVERLTAADDDRAQRQLGVVDADGRGASYTGDECNAWAGHRTGPGYAAQGNILVSAETVDALAETFEATAEKPLVERLLDCLDAAQAAGGDSRGQQSAALLVVGPEQGYAGLSDVFVDLGWTTTSGRSRSSGGSSASISGSSCARRARSGSRSTTSSGASSTSASGGLGYARLEDWAGVQNLESPRGRRGLRSTRSCWKRCAAGREGPRDAPLSRRRARRASRPRSRTARRPRSSSARHRGSRSSRTSPFRLICSRIFASSRTSASATTASASTPAASAASS